MWTRRGASRVGASHVNVHIANSGSKAIVVLSRHDAEPEAVCDEGYGYMYRTSSRPRSSRSSVTASTVI